MLSIVPFQQDLFFRVLILTELRKISKAVPKGLALHTAISKTLRYWEQRFNLQLLENGWSNHCRDIWPHPFLASHEVSLNSRTFPKARTIQLSLATML